MHRSLWDTFHNNEEVEMAFREWLRMQESDLYRGGFLKLIPKWDCDQGTLGQQ
jgi:hypothetical protein